MPAPAAWWRGLFSHIAERGDVRAIQSPLDALTAVKDVLRGVGAAVYCAAPYRADNQGDDYPMPNFHPMPRGQFIA